MNITHELATKLMLDHLSQALEGIERAASLAPDEWDREHIGEIYDKLEGLLVEIKEEIA